MASISKQTMRRVSGSGQMNNMPEGRDRAIEACRLLNDFVSDIVVATRTTNQLERQGVHNQVLLRGVDRMCFSHLIITLSKWAEFYDNYGLVIPEDCRAASKSLRRQIDSRRIRGFRNECVGHIWHKQSRRPLTAAELDQYIETIVGEDPQVFLSWLNQPGGRPEDNQFPNTVVSIVEHTRDRILENFGLGNDDLFGEQ